MFNELKKRIKADNPFPNLLNIKCVERLGENFDLKISCYGFASVRIKDASGKFYKLRIVRSIERAESKERVIRLVPHVLPKFYGRDRNYLLFEFLQGRVLTKNENSDIFFQLGKMCGEVNKVKADIIEKSKFVEWYYKLIENFFKKKVIKFKDYHNISKTYKALLRKVEYEVVLGINDMYLANFVVIPQDKIYLVDELALFYSLKGHDFNRLQRFFSKKQGKSFFRGYNSVNSIKFLTQTYKKLIIFINLIDSFENQLIVKSNYKYILAQLLDCVNHK